MTTNPYVRVVAVLLLLEALAFYAFASRRETAPTVEPLVLFPSVIGDWLIYRDFPIDKEILDILKADDTLNRFYVNQSTRQLAGLYIAYFQTQRYGQAPHSPKNCLPGSGFDAIQNTTIDIPISGEALPIHVNKYIVARGDNRSVVLYWYQSRSRVVASEYMAKIYTMWDAVRTNRTDTALVRVVVPVQQGDTGAAEDLAVSFVRDLFEPLKHYLPA